jgi:SARP family transcriptional regulator, regulator of embCAB operon
MGTVDNGELKLDLLRSWRLRRDDVAIHVATRQQRLIASLAIRGPSLRAHLSGLLWPEYPDARALESLRVSVHLISREVPGLIVNGGPTLSLDERVDVDVQRIRSQIQALRGDRHTGSAASLLHELRDAELLPGWYEDWVVFAQNRLTEDRLQALALVARKSLAAGDPETATEAARATLEIEHAPPWKSSRCSRAPFRSSSKANSSVEIRGQRFVPTSGTGSSCGRTWACSLPPLSRASWPN